jgi:hypothetical protein
MTIHVLTYCYPDGSYAGLIGAYSTDPKAKSMELSLQQDYSDCIFLITEVEVE